MCHSKQSPQHHGFTVENRIHCPHTHVLLLSFSFSVHGHPPNPQFALAELQSLSDSGVYETLTLHSIQSVEYGRGIYHNNWYFTLVLASEHLQHESSQQTFTIIVMKSLDDDVFSFAIDEFPSMQKKSIAAFWRNMVDRHKVLRLESFQRIEREELERDMRNSGMTRTLDEIMATLNTKNGQELEGIVRAAKESAGGGGEEDVSNKAAEDAIMSEIASDILDARWDAQMAEEQKNFDVHVESLIGGRTEL